jgi:hypothetical protein
VISSANISCRPRPNKCGASPAVGETCAERVVHSDVADPIVGARAEALLHGEFSLEELASAADRACGIARDEEDRGVGGHHVALPGADLLDERLANPGVDRVRSLGDDGELRCSRVLPTHQGGDDHRTRDSLQTAEQEMTHY